MPNPETRLSSLSRIKDELARLEREASEAGAHALSVLLRAAISEAADVMEMTRRAPPTFANGSKVSELGPVA